MRAQFWALPFGSCWLLVSFSLLFAAWASASAPASIAARRPHIVFFLADDVGWSNVGWNNDRLITPHMNNLVKEGVLLQRHYAYKFCSPSRSSLLSGRLPIHVNQENSATEQRFAGIPLGMTLWPEKLQALGYRTHQVGKWHVGMATPAHVPTGRGFDSSLTYFNFGEDHYTQIRGGAALSTNTGQACKGVDLWKNDRPAYGLNGTYGGFLFTRESLNVIEQHNVSEPLLLFVAWQNNHPPLQVPRAYIERYPPGERTIINGMTTFLDEAIGNVTAALMRRGMWNDTLVIFCGDNGGYIGSGGDSSPLRGGKFSDFEGGVRVPAFVAGGFVPPQRRGTAVDGYIHLADWYPTLTRLASASGAMRACHGDPRAVAAGLPGLDGVDAWGLIVGEEESARKEVPLSILPPAAARLWPPRTAAYRDPNYFVGGEGLIMGRFKLLRGIQHGSAFFSPTNVSCSGLAAPWTFPKNPGVPCTPSNHDMLFDIIADPLETRDLASALPDVTSRLRDRLEELRSNVYAPDRGDVEQAACHQIDANGGFWGPWLPSLGGGIGGEAAAAGGSAGATEHVLI
mmetsp:Transcript_468/g.933  ORF Transcript_468/g.933 Transcript_468/m.933 type:complete len:570 (-) Transcript_468:290-1999(-)